MIEAKPGAIFIEYGQYDYASDRDTLTKAWRLEMTGEWVEIDPTQIFQGAIDTTEYVDANGEYAEVTDLF